MVEIVDAGFQAPQCTGFVDSAFAVDDISFSIEEQIEARTLIEKYVGTPLPGPLSIEEFIAPPESIGLLASAIDDRFNLENCFMGIEPGQEIFADMIANFENAGSAMENMVCAFPDGDTIGEMLHGDQWDTWRRGADLMAQASDQFEWIKTDYLAGAGNFMRSVAEIRRWIALKKRTLKPVVFTLDWLSLVVRRRRKSAIATGLARLFSFPSSVGWSL